MMSRPVSSRNFEICKSLVLSRIKFPENLKVLSCLEMPFAVLICLECICLVSSLSLVLSCITKSCPDPSNIGQNISKMNIFSTKTLKKQNLAKILQNYCHLCPVIAHIGFKIQSCLDFPVETRRETLSRPVLS